MKVVIGIIFILKGIFWMVYNLNKMSITKDDPYSFIKTISYCLYSVFMGFLITKAGSGEYCLNKPIGYLFIVESIFWIFIWDKQITPKDDHKGAFLMYAIFNFIIGISVWTRFMNICE